MLRVLLLSALLAAALAGDASALTVTFDGGQPAPALQAWLTASYAPADAGRVTVHRAPCFDGQDRACTTTPGDDVWLATTAPQVLRMTLFHELGHRFDYRVMTDAARDAFRRLVHDPRPWHTAPNSPHEVFAAAYSACARHRTLHGELLNREYDYNPSPRTHRRVCRLIWQTAVSQDAAA